MTQCYISKNVMNTVATVNEAPDVFFSPNKFGLFVNSWFYIVVHRNHAVKLLMANVPNKDKSHHRSHTQLNKDKQAFLHLHSQVLYIHKLNPNPAGGSHVPCSRRVT